MVNPALFPEVTNVTVMSPDYIHRYKSNYHMIAVMLDYRHFVECKHVDISFK